MDDITDVTVLMGGLEVIVNRLLIGAKALLVKTTQDVLNKELHFTVTVPEVGPENYVMSNKSRAKLLPKTEVYPALNYVRTEATARIPTTELTVMNVFAYLDLKEVTAKRISMNVLLIHAKMELFVKTLLEHTDASVLKASKDPSVNSTSTIVTLTRVRTMVNVTIWLMDTNAHVPMEQMVFIAKEI